MSEKAVQKKKRKPKRRRTTVEEAPWVVKGQRQSALAHIRALDHRLLLAIGVGLIAFAAGADENDLNIVIAYLLRGRVPPVLCLHLDDGVTSLCYDLVSRSPC